jgi:prevent-host-death family protein
MKTVSAREANHDFSELLSRVERAEQILITKRNKPVALLSPYHPPRLTPERQAAIELAINVMAQGLPWGAAVRAFTRDEMHERMMVSFDTNILVHATFRLPS